MTEEKRVEWLVWLLRHYKGHNCDETYQSWLRHSPFYDPKIRYRTQWNKK